MQISTGVGYMVSGELVPPDRFLRVEERQSGQVLFGEGAAVQGECGCGVWVLVYVQVDAKVGNR